MPHPLRVAIVGVGAMGWNHARVYADLRDVTLIGVVDADGDRAAACAAAFGCDVLADLDAVVARCDAASVAVPSSLHAEIAIPLLRQGVHCLIEKPVAPSAAELSAIEAAATAGAAIVLAGHIERFNPAVDHLPQVLDCGGPILAIDTRRLSGSSTRITDVDVVLDLMVHDLDIVQWLAASEPLSVTAEGARLPGSSDWDHVQVLVRFASGAVASLSASRISQERRRELRILTPELSVVVDHADQSLLLHRQAAMRERSEAYTVDAQVERVLVRTAEPLVRELGHFRDVCLERVEPIIDAASVRATMSLVFQVGEALRASEAR